MTDPRAGRGRTALITGASAGIGLAFARVFARNGFDLVLTGRRTARLLEVKKECERDFAVRVRVITADLARPEAPAEIVSEALRDGGAIDVLVNNAGYGVAGTYLETSWEVQRDFLQVMVTAPCEFAHRLATSMARRRYGRIVNVASVAGLVPGAASHGLYGPAKALMISFSEALSAETRGSGVHVTALCPGFTLSEFHDVNGTRAEMNRLPKFLWLRADRVAEEGYAAVMRGDPLCVPSLVYKLIVGLTRITPRRLALAISLRAQRFRRRR